MIIEGIYRLTLRLFVRPMGDPVMLPAEIANKRDMVLYGETYQNAETGERIDPARVSLSPDRTTWTYSADTET